MFAHGFDMVHEYFIHLETSMSPSFIFGKKLGKGGCHSYKKRILKSYQYSQVHEQTIKETSKGSNEVESSPTDMHHEFNGVIIVGKFITSVEEKVVESTR